MLGFLFEVNVSCRLIKQQKAGLKLRACELIPPIHSKTITVVLYLEPQDMLIVVQRLQHETNAECVHVFEIKTACQEK